MNCNNQEEVNNQEANQEDKLPFNKQTKLKIKREIEDINEKILNEYQNKYVGNFYEYIRNQKAAFCHNMGFLRIHNKISTIDLCRNANLTFDELEQYQLGTCNFDFKKMCQIAYVLDESMEEMMRE